MKKVIILLLAIASPVLAQQQKETPNIIENIAAPVKPVTDKLVKKLATDIQEFVLKDTQYEQTMQKRKLNINKQTLKVKRSVKDCIKPGDLIDDEVQMCVNGTMERYW